LRKIITIDRHGDASVEIVMEGIAWYGQRAPYVEEHKDRFDGLVNKYSRIATLRFDVVWDHGAAVVGEPAIESISRPEVYAYPEYDNKEGFETQPRDRLGGHFVIATNHDHAIDLVFRYKVMNAYATTLQELVWRNGVPRTGPPAPDFERTWHHVHRQTDLMEFEIRFDTGCARADDLLRTAWRGRDPCLELKQRITVRSQEVLCATIAHPVPSSEYELAWPLPDIKMDNGGELAEAARMRLLEVRAAFRSAALAQDRSRVQKDRNAAKVQKWMNDALKTWSDFTGLPEVALDVSLVVPTVPVVNYAAFDHGFLRRVAADHHKVKSDLDRYKIPPLRLIAAAANIKKRPFWDEVYFGFGEGLAGYAFRRNRAVYMDGYNPSLASRAYKPLPSSLPEHHTLVVYPVGQEGWRHPIAVLNLGILNQEDYPVRAKARVQAIEERELEIHRYGEIVRRAGMNLARSLVVASS
jgi:hypothetical protein